MSCKTNAESMDGEHVIAAPQPSGRALLTWDGKYLPPFVSCPKVNLVEEFVVGRQMGADPATTAHGNCLYHGDNLARLAHLLDSGLRGQVRLIYIDPPFDSSADYVRKVRLRDERASQVGRKVEYSDTWTGDSYLQFMYERLLLLRELLSEDGSLWLHCDYRQVHRLHLLLEEVFGSENYLNTISWRSQVTRGAKVNAFYFPYSTQYLEIFAKNRRAPTLWRPQRKHVVFTRRQAAAQFMEDEGGFFRTSDPGTYSFERLVELNRQDRLYAPYDGEILVDVDQRRVYCSNGGNIGVKYYLTEVDNNRYAVARGVDNLWDDIPGLGTTPGEDVGYPTQKTEALLRRVVDASTDPGDLVLDCFVGSGTTVAVAEQMGRRWIGCDANYGAVQTTRRRLQRLLQGSKKGRFALFAVAQECESSAAPACRAVLAVEIEIGRLSGEPTTIEVIVRDVQSPAAQPQPASNVRGTTDDWRAIVDAIEIDPDYDGEVFRPQVVDAPQPKRERVTGRYSMSAANETAVVAVRITDIRGSEELVLVDVSTGLTI